MNDVLEVLKKAREVLKKEGYINLVSEIDAAIRTPTMSISVPKGKLLVGITHIDPESTMAYIDLENEELGQVNLLLAECVEEELRNPGEEEGDIRLYAWEDISNEDYTRTSTITRREIEAQEEYVRDDKPEER